MSVRTKKCDWSYEKKMWNLQKQLQDCLESEPHEGCSKPIYSFSGIHGTQSGTERKQPLFSFPGNNNRNDTTVGGLTTLALLRSNPLLGSAPDFNAYDDVVMTCSDDSDIENLSVKTAQFDIKRPETYFL